LTRVGVGEERARKVLALRGLRGVQRQLGQLDGPGGQMGSNVGHMVEIKARQSRQLESVPGSGSRPESVRGLCGGSPQNRCVT
jgi:hypothetical protein